MTPLGAVPIAPASLYPPVAFSGASTFETVSLALHAERRSIQESVRRVVFIR